MKNLKKLAAKLDDHGRDGDTIVAHINPREAALLKALGGRGTVNPKTGLLEFADSEGQGTSEAGATGSGTESYGSVGGGYGDVGAAPGAGAMAGEDRVAATDIGFGPGMGFGGGYTSDGFSGQLSDFGARDLNRMGRGGPFAGAYESGGLLGAAGRFGANQVDKALSNPIATGINLATGGVFGAANALSGLFGGPTLGGTLTAGGRAVGDALGFNGPQASAQTAATEAKSSSPKGDGGPLSGDTTGGGNSLASGGGGPLSSGNMALANALMGAPQSASPFGPKTFGSLVNSYDPNGRQYVTPWAYRG